MNSSYPIVEQRPLGEAKKQGKLGFKRFVRNGDELPELRPHQMYVFQVGDRFVVHRSRRRLDDDDIVSATSVSVVDMTSAVSVPVELEINSKDSQKFKVSVTFDCTVLDAAQVVQSGCRDASAALGIYLSEHAPITELGLRRRIAEVNEFQLDISAQIKAYAQHVQPTIIGMQVSLNAVTVATPPELEKLHSGINKDEGEHIKADKQAEYMRQMDERQREFEARMADQQNAFERYLAERRAEFSRDQMEKNYQAVGNDPVRAAFFAYENKGISPEQLSEKVKGAEAETDEYREKLRLEAREDKLRNEQWSHEAQVRAQEIEQKDKVRLETWKRQDARDRAALEHEDRAKALEVRLELLREIAKHGYIDQINVNVENLISGLQADAIQQDASLRSALPSGDGRRGSEEKEPRPDAAEASEDLDIDDLSIEDLTEDDEF